MPTLFIPKITYTEFLKPKPESSFKTNYLWLFLAFFSSVNYYPLGVKGIETRAPITSQGQTP